MPLASDRKLSALQLDLATIPEHIFYTFQTNFSILGASEMIGIRKFFCVFLLATVFKDNFAVAQAPPGPIVLVGRHIRLTADQREACRKLHISRVVRLSTLVSETEETPYDIDNDDTLSSLAFRHYGNAFFFDLIVKYNNTRIQELSPQSPRSYGLFKMVGDDYRIFSRAKMFLPPGQYIRGGLSSRDFARSLSIARNDANFEIPGSGSLHPLVATSVRCYVWADLIGNFPAYASANTIITINGRGTNYGRQTFCAGQSRLFSASDWLSNDSGQRCASKKGVEIPIARDAVVIAINRNHPYVPRDGRLNLSAGEVCTLLESPDPEVESLEPPAPITRYLPTTDSGTARFVGRRLCGDDKSLLSLAVSPADRRTEDYKEGARRIANDPYGIGVLPYPFFLERSDKLVAIAINGIKPDQQNTKPGAIEDEDSTCAQLPDRTAYCLSRFLWIYVDEETLRMKGTIYGILKFITGTPSIADNLRYIPLRADDRSKASKMLDRD